MSKILVVACVATVVVVSAGYSLLGGNKSEQGNNEMSNNSNFENSVKDTSSETSENNDNKDGNYYETMTDLMARGKSVKCTYTQEVEGGGTAAGVVYMADKKARTEITVNEDSGRAGKMYAIIDHEWTYSWVEGSSKGYKMTLEASELDKKQKEDVSDLAKEIDFKCKSWKKDSSKFKVPSNVVFENLTEMIEDMGDFNIAEEVENAEAQANEFLCNHCKNAPTPELVAECLGDVVCD